MEVIEKILRVYIDPSGQIPFAVWLRSLRDERARQKIQVRLGRVRLGNFGVVRPVGEGISELVIDYGPGYRIYFNQTGDEIVILLLGGDKSTQDNDIRRAKEYWYDYKEQKKTDNY